MVLKDHKEYKVIPDLRDQLDPQGLTVLMVPMVHKDRRDLQD